MQLFVVCVACGYKAVFVCVGPKSILHFCHRCCHWYLHQSIYHFFCIQPWECLILTSVTITPPPPPSLIKLFYLVFCLQSSHLLFGFHFRILLFCLFISYHYLTNLFSDWILYYRCHWLLWSSHLHRIRLCWDSWMNFISFLVPPTLLSDC